MITTVTLNPAFDKMLSVAEIQIGETNRTQNVFYLRRGQGH